ncbi:hydantoinase B/oxoprolinase family protein [Stetteria hydrogenophila]
MSGDRVLREVIRNAAIYIAEEMGVVLRNTAYSPNIKDRLDHSCAILSPEGLLVAQAEHIPVHLGSMAVGVENTLRRLREEGEELEPGDVVMVNDPYIAGTHLNDVMLLKPVYAGGRLIAVVANKAHHVDVGGSVPGSIGGDVRELLQEGVVVPPVKLARRGVIQWNLVRLISANVRTPRHFKGDLMAQLAALNVGERRLKELAGKYGADAILDAWEYTLDYTERYTRRKIAREARPGSYEAEDYIELPGGGLAAIHARIVVEGDGVKVDFTGTHRQVDAPVNAVYGVTVAATTFALKSVIDPEMPFNHGFLRAVEIHAPRGSLVNPEPPAPVSGGNVETSQRIVDVIHRALAEAFPGRVPAASAGSMNNVMVGGGSWAFYETIGGGGGARPTMDGVDGVHTNMTNTLNTPIERAENEYPLLFVKYELRPDSGGPGYYRGGLGITRAFKILSEEAVLTIMAERTMTRPWGLNGGLPGAPGEHYIVRASGEVERLPGKATVTLRRGDTVYINTPGGGGYGDPCRRPRELVRRDIEEGKVSRGAAVKYYCFREDE